jgi:hypothetical protein
VKDGKLVDAGGNPATIMKKQGFWGSLANPEGAEYANEANAEMSQSTVKNQMAQQIQRINAGNAIDTVPWQERSSSGDSNLGTPWSNTTDPKDPLNQNLYTGIANNANNDFKPNYHNDTANSIIMPMSPAGQHNANLAKAQRELEITRYLNPELRPTSINTQLSAQAGMPYAASTGELSAHGANVTAKAELTKANTDQILAQNRLANVNDLAQASNLELANMIKNGTLTGQQLDDTIKLRPELAEIAKNKADFDKATSGAQANPTNLSKTVGTIGLQADTANQLAGGENKASPYEAYQRFNNAVAAANASKWAPPLSALGLPVNADGTMGGLTKVPGGLTPQAASYMGMSGMFGAGGMNNMPGATSPVATTSAGKFTTPIPSAPAVTSVLPSDGYGLGQSNGTNIHPAFEQEQNFKPIEGLEGYYTDGRLVKDSSGNDVTQQMANNPITKRIVATHLSKIEEKNAKEQAKNDKKIQDVKDALHDSLQADLKAKHLSSSPLSQEGNFLLGMGKDIGYNYNPLTQAAAHGYNAYEKGTKLSRQLIGQGYNWLTKDQY